MIRPKDLGLPDISIVPREGIVLGSCYGDAAALVAATIAHAEAGPVVLIAESVAQAEAFEASLAFFDPRQGRICHFPDPETLPYDDFSPHEELISRRLEGLRRIQEGACSVIVVAVPTLLGRLPPPAWLAGHSLRLDTGQAIGREELLGYLDNAGYQRSPQVTMHGEYAVRGSLLDVFPMGCDWPVRIDFFDHEIESMRHFDPDSQLTTDRITSFSSMPAREFPFADDDVRQFRERFRMRFAGNPTRNDIYREVSEHRLPGGIENYMPLFFEETANFWDFVPDHARIFALGDLFAALDIAWKQANERHAQFTLDPDRTLLSPEELFVAPKEHAARLTDRGMITLNPVESADSPNLAIGPPMRIQGDPTESTPVRPIAAALSNTRSRTLVVAESPGRREMLLEGLRDDGVSVTQTEGWQAFLDAQSAVCVTDAPVGRGFTLRTPAISVISEQEILGHPPHRRRKRRVRDPDSIINDLKDLTSNSPVVHQDYGVGRYVGLSRLDIDDMPTEFVTIEYAGGDLLHVPVGSLHLITRYTGGPPENAPLHRLGTDQWARAKRKAAERIRDVAAELLEIYARRASRTGISTPVDSHDFRAFAAGFPFELTDDQANAIDDVLADLSSSQPMDRLVCGDVGFGKTEVALRASFAAVQAGRQVAVLVPTTLLAQQHYQTFIDRYADWPVRVESLSRFVSGARTRVILEDLRRGVVDIVIGTHKLLQRGIEFSDLGLVIIDEEHRFGVRHKERLKTLRAEVDVLTLTATPIPRTLNMALGNLRELSLITTPPESRLSIKTFVIEWNDAIIREACERELKRGGQVYFVHNRVEDIQRIAESVRKLLPSARVEVAHGQMREKDLERVMLDFYHRRFHVLVCTSIIESGLDVPTANTILINRADRFGLAQLHQLRGRVGRSHHKAFAYLIAPPLRSVTPDAAKRLEAIESLEDLGAGFVLATHDLEIRGAGELLGDDQSGQMQEIGFSMYAELLARTVDALRAGRGLDLDEPVDRGTEVELHVPALFPNDYMPDVHMRLVQYKRIASAPDTDALTRLRIEVVDRFGVLPESAANLFRMSEIRLQLADVGIKRIEANTTGITVEFRSDTSVSPQSLVELVTADPGTYRLDKQMRLRCSQSLPDDESRFEAVQDMVALLHSNSTDRPAEEAGKS